MTTLMAPIALRRRGPKVATLMMPEMTRPMVDAPGKRSSRASGLIVVLWLTPHLSVVYRPTVLPVLQPQVASMFEAQEPSTSLGETEKNGPLLGGGGCLLAISWSISCCFW